MDILNVTLNPNDMGSSNTLSNGNLTVASTSYGIRATHGKTSGKWYWEVKLDSGTDLRFALGISNKSFSFTSIAFASPNWRSFGGIGNRYPENTSYGTGLAVGDVIGVALDLDSGKLEFLKNGISIGFSHTNVKELGEVYPTMGALVASTTARVVTFNFGATSFTYNIPSGFLAYNSKPSYKILLSSGDKYYSIAPPVYVTETAIPAMTSNTTPSGRVFFSSEFSVNYQGWKAFDKIDNLEGFATANGSGDIGYLGYEFVDSIMIGKYVLRSGTLSVNFLPKKWTFEGSNDGTNWTVLDTQSNQVWTTAYTDKEYIIHANKLGRYKMYRLNWTEKNGDATYTHLNELKLFEAKPSKWVELSELTEQNFLKYGTDTSINISQFRTIIDAKTNPITFSSGKNFEHTIDMSKRRVDKITLG